MQQSDSSGGAPAAVEESRDDARAARDADEEDIDAEVEEEEGSSSSETELRDNISYAMSEMHLSVKEKSRDFRLRKRFNYCTPKSYLELIALFRSMLESKVEKLDNQVNRLEKGLGKLQKTSEDVGELQKDLHDTMVLVEKRSATLIPFWTRWGSKDPMQSSIWSMRKRKLIRLRQHQKRRERLKRRRRLNLRPQNLQWRGQRRQCDVWTSLVSAS